jgi:hypothetical protein
MTSETVAEPPTNEPLNLSIADLGVILRKDGFERRSGDRVSKTCLWTAL